MCLAIPMKVIEINGNVGTIELGGVRRTADISLVSEVQIGQYVIVHAGFALSILNEVEAEKTLTLFSNISDYNALETTSPKDRL